MKIKKILVSQPRPATEKSPYFEITEKYGVKIDFRPFIKVDPIPAKEFRTQNVNILDHSAIIFTAKTGIDHFFRLCSEMRITIPETMKYFCLSESIALYLQKYIQFRKRKVFISDTGKLPALVELIKKHNDEKYLVVLSEQYNDEIVKMLDELKVTYKIGLMYRTVSNDFQEGEKFDYDMLVFFSPQGVYSLLKNFPNFEQGDIQIGCFGPTTAQAVRDANLRLDLAVPSPQCPSMAAALLQHVKENHKACKKPL